MHKRDVGLEIIIIVSELCAFTNVRPFSSCALSCLSFARNLKNSKSHRMAELERVLYRDNFGCRWMNLEQLFI